MKKLLNSKEAQHQLKAVHGVDIHLRTLERWTREGKTPARQFMGRVYFEEREFDRWAKRQFKPLVKSLRKPLAR